MKEKNAVCRAPVGGFGVAALVATGALMAAPAANATVGQCPIGVMCAWADPGYGVKFLNAGTANAHYGASGFHDIASAFYNHTTRAGNYYEDDYYQGRVARLQAGQVWENVWTATSWWFPTTFDDKADSSRRD